LNRERLYWFIQIIGWSCYGFASILLYSFVQEDIADSLYVGEVFQIIFYILSTHLLRLLIKKGQWISGAWSWLAGKVLVSIVVLSISNYLFLLGVSYFLGTINNQDFQAVNAFISIIAPLIMYFLWSSIYLTFHYFQWYNKSLKYEAAINEIELNYLKSQLNPHFIFNALNSIRALVDENPAKSKDAITHLSTILRNSLMLDKKKLVAFEDEMRTVKDYLALESIRFEERLVTNFQIHPDSSRYQIPPMMIQTLVENGIKHGISKLTKGGEIEIKTEVQKGSLHISIYNSGVYSETSKKNKNGTGFGLKNTRKRLELLYGASAHFSIENIGSNTVLTEIRIPEQVLMAKSFVES
jgi:two-component system LytT family sensor kinase